MTDTKDKSAHRTLEPTGIRVVPLHMAADFKAAQDSSGAQAGEEIRAIIIDLPYEDDYQPG